MKPDIRTMIAVISILTLSACMMVDDNGQIIDSQHAKTLDGVKLISSSIEDQEDGRTWEQGTYRLAPQARLLLRFETLMDEQSSIRTEDSRKVELLLAFETKADAERAKNVLQICPVLRNWMMLATWDRAHPFNSSGVWSSPGGDFDTAGCMRITDSTVKEGFVSVDVTPWFLNYVRGRGQNYGLILVASEELTVIGDANGALSPRFRWTTSTYAGIPF